ncbi:MAG: DNA polymerase III subunit delta [Phascolarctobacterium sp.]|nr:DNA polymerase III subunit delta [Phascolarctobacterium sp.]
MTTYKPEELLKKLNKRDSLQERIILVYGEDSYYRQRINSAIANFVYGDTPEEDREITVFEKDTNLGELEGVINSYPFFSGSSLVVLKDEKLLGKAESENVKKQQERLGKILSDIPEYCTVFISAVKLDGRTKFAKDLIKQAAACSCEPIKVYNLGDWLNEKAEELGGSLDRNAQECIMEYLEPLEVAPLQLLEQELEKLAVYAGERKRWTQKDVEEIFASLPEVGSFALSNAVAEHKLIAALEILAAEEKKGTAIIKLCGGLMFQLRKMLQIKELQEEHYNPKQIGEAMGIRFSGILNRNIAQCRKFTYGELQDALLAMAQLNIDLRSGGRQYSKLKEILVRLLNPRG